MMTGEIVVQYAQRVVDVERAKRFKVGAIESPTVRFDAFYESCQERERHDRELRGAAMTRRDRIIGWSILATGCVAIGVFLALLALGLRDVIQAIGGSL